jgi:hypothetical protein
VIFAPSGFSDTFVDVLQSLGILHTYSAVDSSLRINTNLLSMICEGGALLGLN